MSRQDDNRCILALLTQAVEAWPDARFGQLLVAYDVLQLIPNSPEQGGYAAKDPFHEESATTLKRMEQSGLAGAVAVEKA